MTVTRSTSRGSASETAALNRRTACEPPKISSTRSPGGMPRRCRAASRSIARVSRIGVPVTKQGTPGAAPASASQVASNDTAMHVGQARRRADGPAGDDVAVPEHDRDAQRRRGQQDRDAT